MTRIRISLLLSILAALLMMPGLPSWAQDAPANNMDIVREKIRTDKKLFISQNLALTESQAKGFWPIYDSYQKDLQTLGDRLVALVSNYAKEYRTMSDGAAKKLTDEYLDINGDLQTLRKAYLPQFQKVLPDTKVASYYQLEQKVHALLNCELAGRIPLMKYVERSEQ